MNEASKEQLSALLDGELGPDETRFLLRRMTGATTLAETWTRYAIIGETLRGEHLPASTGFSVRVMRELTAAPAASRGGMRWLRYGVGGGLAASIAVAAMIWLQPVPGPQAPGLAADAPMADASLQVAAAPAAQVPATADSGAAAPDLDALLRLDGGAYPGVLRAAATRGGQGPLRTPVQVAPPAWARAGASRRASWPEPVIILAREAPRQPAPPPREAEPAESAAAGD